MATLSEDEKRAAEDAAEDVIQDTFGGLDSVKFPLDINLVIEKYGLTLKKGDFKEDNISGAFSREDSTIYVSNADSPQRQLFTVAHEIGHYRLHDSKQVDILYRKQIWEFGNGSEADETQANWFAANLLMPRRAVKQIWKITNDVDRIAIFFGVSKTAVYFRLKDLNLIK